MTKKVKKVSQKEKNPEVSSEKARMVLMNESQEREKRCALRIEEVLKEEGFRLDIKPQIVLVPIR